jgi:hypothetical protein
MVEAVYFSKWVVTPWQTWRCQNLEVCILDQSTLNKYYVIKVSGLENREYCRGDPLRWPRDTLYPLKLAPTSSTSVYRSVGIVRLRTKATEFVCLIKVPSRWKQNHPPTHWQSSAWTQNVINSEGYNGKQFWRLLTWQIFSTVCSPTNSPPNSTEVKNTWIYTSIPPYIFMA